MKIVEEGEIGEICCAGVMVSDGYISARESDSFLPNPYESEERELLQIFQFEKSKTHATSQPTTECTEQAISE